MMTTILDDPHRLRGARGERIVAAWLLSIGYSVIELGRCDDPEGRAMQVPIRLPDGSDLVSPDLLIIRDGIVRGLQVKTKQQATWSTARREWHVGLRIRELARLEHAAALLPMSLVFWLEETAALGDDLAPSGFYTAPRAWDDPRIVSHDHADTRYLRLGALAYYRKGEEIIW